MRHCAAPLAMIYSPLAPRCGEQQLGRPFPAGRRIVARNNSILGLVYAVNSGIAIAPLPTALGDADKDLVRVLGPIEELTRPILTG